MVVDFFLLMKLENMFTTLGDATFKVYNIEDEKKAF